MTREEKAQIIAELTERLQGTTGLYLTNFTGMTVEQANNLRREFHKIGVDYKVVKNTLAKRAFADAGGYGDLSKYLVGPTGIVFAKDDPVAPAKVIKKFIDGTQKPELKACIIEKVVFDGARLAEVANLPTRAELIASMLGSIQAPIAGIAGAIGGLHRDLVNILDAIEKKMAEANA